MSIEELARIIPVRPPMVNKKMNPNDHSEDGNILILEP